MSKRLTEIDSIRAVVALSVIMIHVSGIYVAFSSTAYFANQLTRFAVPFFILLSGFSLYYSDINRKPESYFSFLGKRLKKIAIPYVIWTFLFMLYHMIVNNKTYSIKEIPEILLFAQAHYHLYFVIIIVQLYLIYPFLRKFFEKHHRLILWVSLVISLYYQTSVYLSLMKINLLPLIPMGLQPHMVVFTWIFFFVLGMELAKGSEALNTVIRHRWLLGLGWAASLGLVFIDGKLTHTFESSIRPSVMVYVVLSFYFFYSLSNALKAGFPKLEAALSWLSGQSYFIYFFHAMVLSFMVKYLQKGPLAFLFSRGLGMGILFVLVTVLTILSAFVVSFLPFQSYLGCKKVKLKIR